MASKAKKSTKKTPETSPPAKRPVAGKKGAKPEAPKRTTAAAKRPPARAKPGAKTPAGATRSATRLTGKSPAAGPAAKKKAAAGSSGQRGNGLSAKELKDYQQLLLNLRDRVIDEISFLAGDNLSGDNLERTGEEGTDNFNREFSLKLVSSDQDIIYEIDEALRRIRQGTYGICEISGQPIEKERLRVIPHARHCMAVQTALEKGRARFRPFDPATLPRG